MKKISKINWELFKNSPNGQQTIGKFRKLTSPECTIEEMLSIAKEFDAQFFSNFSGKEEETFKKILQELDGAISEFLPESFADENELWDFYSWLIKAFASENEDVSFEDLPQSDFKNILQDNLFLSIILFAYLPEYYIPNFFVLQFVPLKRFASKYEIDLPEVPIRSDYRSRCLYYVEICKILKEFSRENDFESPEEFCAYLFGYELPLAFEELEAEYSKPIPIVPENAWILVGNYGDGEKSMDHGLWQANQMTRKGDVLLFYEKSPVKKLNAVWTALENGVLDPFFYYYSYTIIGQKIEIPSVQAITFEDFKNSEYFKVENRGREGNFVSKKFQDVSGWAVYYKDYAEIKRMLAAKGFDVNVLPSLEEPMDFSAKEITNEEDVYNKLITPLLEQMGWEKGKDFEREVEFAAGHTTTHHPSNKRPDYCLHVTRQDGKVKESKVVIEAKELFKGTADVDECFDQCESYARWGKAKVLVICDKIHIFVYEQDRNGSFYKDKHKTTFTWAKLKEDEEFKRLKRKLDI